MKKEKPIYYFLLGLFGNLFVMIILLILYFIHTYSIKEPSPIGTVILILSFCAEVIWLIFKYNKHKPLSQGIISSYFILLLIAGTCGSF